MPCLRGYRGGVAPYPYWRPERASSTALAEHLARTAGFPTYLPWPLTAGWKVADFGAVGEPGRTRATVAAVVGDLPEDGPASVAIVSEEPGCGLGARVAGMRHVDPGGEIGDRPADVRARVGSSSVPLWTVSTHDASAEFDRSVLVGEAAGRWLWVVLWPASAVLALRGVWPVAELSTVPHAALAFGGTPPGW